MHKATMWLNKQKTKYRSMISYLMHEKRKEVGWEFLGSEAAFREGRGWSGWPSVVTNRRLVSSQMLGRPPENRGDRQTQAISHLTSGTWGQHGKALRGGSIPASGEPQEGGAVGPTDLSWPEIEFKRESEGAI